MTKKTVVRTVSATEAQNRFGALIKHAYADEEHVIVERGGIPVVAIVPMHDYERLIAGEEKRDSMAGEVTPGGAASAARARLKAFLAESRDQIPYVTDEEIEKDIQEAITEIRRQK